MYVLILPNYLDTAQLLSVTRIEEKLNCVIDGSYFDAPRVEFTVCKSTSKRGSSPTVKEGWLRAESALPYDRASAPVAAQSGSPEGISRSAG